MRNVKEFVTIVNSLDNKSELLVQVFCQLEKIKKIFIQFCVYFKSNNQIVQFDAYKSLNSKLKNVHS